jgi:hypothetical protein
MICNFQQGACLDVAQISNLPYRRFPIGRASAGRTGCRHPVVRRLETLRYSAARLAPQPNFGLRREAKRHAALASIAGVPKAVSALRSATAVQKSTQPATILADTDRLQVCATTDGIVLERERSEKSKLTGAEQPLARTPQQEQSLPVKHRFAAGLLDLATS